MPVRHHDFARLNHLHRRYDGPVPDQGRSRPDPRGRARLFDRLALEAVAELGRRRRLVRAAALEEDYRLRVLERALGHYRCQGRAWAEARRRGSRP